MTSYKSKECKMKCKINLIKLYNILVDSGDTDGCCNEFFDMVNGLFNKSINTTMANITIGDFLTNMNVDSWISSDCMGLMNVIKY